MTGLCFDIQRYAIHDGPGIRTTVFLKGCPLSCPWCHNPEGLAPEREILLVPGLCIQCGSCVEACPDADGVARTAEEPGAAVRCVRCGECVEVCSADARRWVGEELTVEELLARVERDRPFYEQSGGGVTFSGGEPLMQPRFLLASLRACQERGLHTAVDTSGYAETERILEIACSTDLFLYDLKTVDDERHREQTGVPAAPILENLRALDAAGAEIWVRVPLIPDFNSDRQAIAAIGAFVIGLPRARRVHLLPYHALGEDKRSRLEPRRSEAAPLEPRRSETGAREAPPRDSAESIDEALQSLQALGLDVRVGG